ncbi:MAG TPA: phosphoglycerate dehydrogenase [Clostridiaceae bacterium]|jgi:D-3-phosphoglycerate dehydrogenase|nr:phosphoglycerate dehydrogenase [Clostridiaceae bacterium]
MRIIVTESIAEEGIQYLIDNGFDVDVRFGIDREELLSVIENYDAIIIRSVTKIDDELLEKAKNLKVVGRAGNGVDNIKLGSCTKRGIIVVNTPESNIMAAAELAVGLAFAVFRNIVQAVSAGRNNDFRRGNFIGNELDGKVAGIVGLGRIGSIVARKLLGCNMKVVAYDPYITEERFNKMGVVRCETLEDLLKQSDLITIHTPKTNETYGMIADKELAMCKDGVRIVNAARGGIVDEKALYDALLSGKVAAAALDVLDPEPNYNLPPEKQTYTNPLLSLDNCICTPHLGASTQEANFNVGTAVAELVGRALKGEVVPAVNMPPLKAVDMEEIRPYIDMAIMLGKIYYQAEKKRVRRIEITYKGDLADKDTEIFTLSVIKGFLQPIIETPVNYVNAYHLLESMGVELVVSKSTKLHKYTNLISVNFVTSDKELSVAGTVFAKEEIRLVDFFGYKLDFEPSENVLAIHNKDVPGMIGKIGTILGESGINIAAMQWSRKERGDKAEAFVSVDQEVPDNVVDKIKQLEGVLKVSRLSF